MELLNTKTSKIKLSLDSLLKNKINHPELKLEDYKKIKRIISKPDEVIQDGEYHIKLFKRISNNLYEAVIKTTKNRNENFFVSFHLSNIKRMKKQF